MEHEIAGQTVKAAMDGALVGTADRKKEPMTGKKALKAMERVMNALFFICGMVAVAFVLLISIYLIICLLYTSPSPRDRQKSRMPSSA